MRRSIGASRQATRQRGQTAIEFAALVVILIAAIVTMQVYVKRGIMGRARQTADSLGEQFDPKDYKSTFNEAEVSDVINESVFKKDQPVCADKNGQTVKCNVVESTTTIRQESTTKRGAEEVGKLKDNVWE